MITTSCESARASLEVKKQNGDVFTVEVTQSDYVSSLKTKITQSTGVPEWKQTLTAGDQVLSITQSVSAITPMPTSLDLVIQEPFSFLPKLLMYVACQGSSDLQVDVVSGKTWEARYLRGFEPTGIPMQTSYSHGRHGLVMTSDQLLKAPESIDVGDACTIAMWTLFPFTPRQLDLRGDHPLPPLLFEILSGPPPCDGAVVVGGASLAVGSQDHLKINREPSPNDFDLMSLPPGWHHIVEVISGADIHHYVDGELIGSTQLEKDLGGLKLKMMAILMRQSHAEGSGVVSVSDVCFFGCAATADQVKMLASSA